MLRIARSTLIVLSVLSRKKRCPSIIIDIGIVRTLKVHKGNFPSTLYYKYQIFMIFIILFYKQATTTPVNEKLMRWIKQGDIWVKKS